MRAVAQLEPAVAAPVARPLREAGAAGHTGAVAQARYLVDVTLHLVGRQLTRRYRRSLLGWLWAVVPPVAQLAVVYLVFTRIIPVRIDNYAAFLFIGIITWSWLATSLTLATSSIESRRDLVMRPGFPTPLLPLVAALVALVDYFFALPFLLGVLAFYGTLSPAVLFLPVLLAIQLLLVAGLSWLVAPLNVFFRDIGHLVGLLLLLGYFMTPVFYSRDQAPKSFSLLYDLNPMARLIEAQRAVLLDGALPAAVPLALIGAVAVVVAAVGYSVFALVRPSLADQL